MLNQILAKYDEKRYLSQFVILCSKNKGAPHSQYVTTAACWIPDLPNIKHNDVNVNVYVIGHSPSGLFRTK